MSIDMHFCVFENFTWHFGFEAECQMKFVKHKHYESDYQVTPFGPVFLNNGFSTVNYLLDPNDAENDHNCFIESQGDNMGFIMTKFILFWFCLFFFHKTYSLNVCGLAAKELKKMTRPNGILFDKGNLRITYGGQWIIIEE
jgi:hypothetical protein